jgi:hypothetical protein
MTARWSNLPGRCKCSHRAHAGMFPQYPCACQTYRDAAEVQAAQERHPAGKSSGGAA